MDQTLDLNLLQLAAILGAGVIAGFINTLAGGGSLLTIPALLFAGLPSTVANATNRVAARALQLPTPLRRIATARPATHRVAALGYIKNEMNMHIHQISYSIVVVC